ncbi:MAG: protein kinase [Planctomycetota bacterium]
MTEAGSILCRNLVQAKGSPPIIGGAVLHRVIGSGGMGVVYRGTHLRLRVPVAVKFLVVDSSDQFSVSRFVDEASLAAKISSPNVVRVFDVNTEDGFVFIVQEFVHGITADQRLRDAVYQKQKLNEDFILEFAADTARGLAAIHESSYLHLDIKPANIMISERNGGCKILDFGLARAFDKNVVSGTPALPGEEWVDGGTPGYASPEQLNMLHVGPSSDIYSLGITIYEMLCARNCFNVTTWEEAQRIQTVEQVPDVREYRPDISAATAGLISKCLHINPNERYQSAMELLSAIAKVKQSRLTGTQTPAPSARAPILSVRHEFTKPVSLPIMTPYVVCVDDDAQICMLMSELLQSSGYRVEAFTSGARALDHMAFDPPDVVFLDMEMPGISGLEICKKIRSSQTLQNIPVVFITGETSPDIMRRAISEGATDYLFKPIQVDDMVSRVQCLSRISRAHRELAHLQSQFGQFRNRLSTLSGRELA